MKNMKITILDSIPNIMFDRLVSFEEDFNGKSWDELYSAMIALHKEYPEVVIANSPRLYSDLSSKTFGFLILDQKTDNFYYIHK
jgi:hypothetical protein